MRMSIIILQYALRPSFHLPSLCTLDNTIRVSKEKKKASCPEYDRCERKATRPTMRANYSRYRSTLGAKEQMPV